MTPLQDPPWLLLIHKIPPAPSYLRVKIGRRLQALGAVRVSRTVQTLREVAGLKSAGWRREAEEAALTAMYLSTLLSWLRDDTAGAAASRDRLRRWLSRADWLVRRLP